MHIGIATDHGGFGVKEELDARIQVMGHEVVDFGAQLESRLRCPPRSSGRGRQGESLHGDLRQRRQRVGLREQSKRRPRLSHSRSFFCEARRRRRSYEHPLHGQTNHWPGSRLGFRSNLSRRRIPQRPATSSSLGQDRRT